MRSIEEMRALLAQRRVDLPNARLARGIEFLERSGTPQGWGVIAGTGFDRHASALAMEAMISVSDVSNGEGLIANIGISAKRRYAEQIRGLLIESFPDVVTLLREGIDEEPELRQAVERRARELVRATFKDVPADGSRHLARLVVAIKGLNVSLGGLANQVHNFWTEEQNVSDGSWSVARNAPGTLAATAEVLRAMADLERDFVSDARLRGSRWLSAEVERRIEDADAMETVDVAITLRTLAGDGDGERGYGIVLPLEDELVRRQGTDGGWPSRNGRPSTTESTALAVLALVAAGARAHVPLRLAQSIVDLAEARVAELSAECDQLKQQAGAQVREGVREVIAERRRLAQEVRELRERVEKLPELEGELAALRRVTDPVVYETQLIAQDERAAQAQRRLVQAVAGSLLVTLAAVSAVAQGAILRWSFLGLAIIVALSLSAMQIVDLRRARRNTVLLSAVSARSRAQWAFLPDAVSSDQRIQQLRRTLVRIVADWPSGARRELPYVLYEDFRGLPSDVAARRAESVALRLGAPANSVPAFSRWAASVGLLEAEERQVLFDQLRRTL
jgi:hypothetical protein